MRNRDYGCVPDVLSVTGSHVPPSTNVVGRLEAIDHVIYVLHQLVRSRSQAGEAKVLRAGPGLPHDVGSLQECTSSGIEIDEGIFATSRCTSHVASTRDVETLRRVDVLDDPPVS